MKKDELIITFILAAVLLAGSSYQYFRGGNKTAEVIVTHGDRTPYDASNNTQPALPPPSNATNDITVSTFPNLNPNSKQQRYGLQNNQYNAIIKWLNHANKEQWQQIPGIGERTATRILEYRNQNNGFQFIDQLDAISGIGEKRLEDILIYLQNKLFTRSAADRRDISKTVHPDGNPVSAANQKISINQASGEDLEQVSGIGSSTARRILDERAKYRHGFQRWEQVSSIPGIGESRLQSLQEQFTLD